MFTQRWPLVDPRLTPGWPQVDPRLTPGWPQVDPRLTQLDPRWTQGSPQLNPRSTQAWPQLDPSLTRGLDNDASVRVQNEAPGFRSAPREGDASACIWRHQAFALTPCRLTQDWPQGDAAWFQRLNLEFDKLVFKVFSLCTGWPRLVAALDAELWWSALKLSFWIFIFAPLHQGEDVDRPGGEDGCEECEGGHGPQQRKGGLQRVDLALVHFSFIYSLFIYLLSLSIDLFTYRLLLVQWHNGESERKRDKLLSHSNDERGTSLHEMVLARIDRTLAPGPKHQSPTGPTRLLKASQVLTLVHVSSSREHILCNTLVGFSGFERIVDSFRII